MSYSPLALAFVIAALTAPRSSESPFLTATPYSSRKNEPARSSRQQQQRQSRLCLGRQRIRDNPIGLTRTLGRFAATHFSPVVPPRTPTLFPFRSAALLIAVPFEHVARQKRAAAASESETSFKRLILLKNKRRWASYQVWGIKARSADSLQACSLLANY